MYAYWNFTKIVVCFRCWSFHQFFYVQRSVFIVMVSMDYRYYCLCIFITGIKVEWMWYEMYVKEKKSVELCAHIWIRVRLSGCLTLWLDDRFVRLKITNWYERQWSLSWNKHTHVHGVTRPHTITVLAHIDINRMWTENKEPETERFDTFIRLVVMLTQRSRSDIKHVR